MSAFAVIRAIASGIGLAFSATRRLNRALADAARQDSSAPLEPDALKPPPPLGSGYPDALSYLRGANDERWREAERARMRAQAEQLARDAAAGDDGPAEKPKGGKR